MKARGETTVEAKFFFSSDFALRPLAIDDQDRFMGPDKRLAALDRDHRACSSARDCLCNFARSFSSIVSADRRTASAHLYLPEFFFPTGHTFRDLPAAIENHFELEHV